MLKKVLNKYSLMGLGFLFIFLILLILLMSVDKASNIYKEIGLYNFNKIFLVDYYNESWDGFSDVILYISILFILGLIIYGIYQLYKRKSLFKVDKDIILTGFGFVFIIIIWFIFDKFIDINYRPIAVNGSAQTSFPSTHVMLACFSLLATTRIILKRNTNELKYNIITYGGVSILVILCSLGRILSKMHWTTDVLGAIFISLAIFFIIIGLDKALEE